jgi:DNA (cytosine-5)-methyltransferase 1
MDYTTIGDLFCGAGIGAVGAREVGLKTVYAYDNNKHAINTYNHNLHKDKPLAAIKDLKTACFEDIPYSDVIMAGFPCQSFSVAGKGLGVNDPDKGNLGKITFDIIMNKLPKAFLLENVKGLSSKKNIKFLEELVRGFEEEYEVTWEIKDCSNYGVPQKRERVFIVGIRKDLNSTFNFPKETHKIHKVSIRDAIGDIKVKGNYLPNHDVDCGIRKDEQPYIHLVPEGGCWKDLPCEDMKKDFMKGAYDSSGGRTTYLSVINKNKPARTILSSPMGKNSSQIIRWEHGKERRYTVRESLRLQTVPDWFEFPESVPLMKQYERCSGIPSLVSALFLREIKRIITS